MWVVNIIFASVSVVVILQLIYPFLTVIASRLFGKERLVQQTNRLHDYGCIITAYKNAAIAQPLIESLLRQDYPHFTIYLVADECTPVDFQVNDTRFHVMYPAEPLRLKAKSIIYAMSRYKRAHDYTIVFDADNLAHPDFLREINRYANAGHRCIQGQRTAKNLDTTYAALDSMGEHYKNYIERYVPYLLGGAAVISGSGMATETSLYMAYLNSPEIEQGKQQWKKMLQEDKILQNFLLRQNVGIAYARKAIVFDEKVETGAAVETQRSRWLFSYFQNVPNALGILRRGLTGLHFKQIYFGLVTLVLPMFMQVALAGLLFLIGWLVNPTWSLFLMAAMGIFALTIPLVLYFDQAPQPIWNAFWQVPKFVWRQFRGLFKMRNPNKHFSHTEHRKYVHVDDLLNRDQK